MSSSGWKEVKLGEVVNVLSGYAFKSKDFCNNGIPVIKIKNITPPYVILDDVQYVSKELSEEKSRYKLNYNDVLISLTGSNVNQFASAVGKVGRIKINKPMMLNQRVGKFEILDKSVYNLDFLYYLISTEEMHYKLALNAGGAANQANISPSMIKNVDLPCPPIEEQEAIAATLSCLDDKIELNNRINKTLEKMAQAIFKSWFVDFEPFQDGEFEDSELGRIPKGWRSGTLGEIASITSGKRPLQKQTTISEEMYVPVVGASSIMAYTNEVLYDEKILITGRVGTHGIIQRFNNLCWASDNTLVIKSERYEFVYQILNNVDFKSMNRGSTQPLITQTDLKNVRIIIPSNLVLENYEIITSKIMDVWQENNNQNKTLTTIRNSLLPKLMSGEIRVPTEEV